MAVLFVLGAMSLFWMAVVAVVIFVEKVLPRGPRLAPVFAVAVVALGIWVTVSPGRDVDRHLRPRSVSSRCGSCPSARERGRGGDQSPALSMLLILEARLAFCSSFRIAQMAR
jgi:hypothetical protein